MISVRSTDLGVDELDYALHMRHAIALAQRVLTATPNPRVGCVIVRRGIDEPVVGEGWHKAPGTEHAEINALAQAGEAAHGATVFVSLEPCAHHGKTPPCADALVAAGVAEVVIAGLDPFPGVAGKGVAKLEAAGIRVVHLTDFESRARMVNAGYFMRLEQGRPFVRCKLAMSLDGRTATENRESKWISDPQSRARVQRLRACSCAILTGIGTVLQDDPSLTVRADEIDLSNQERQRNGFALSRQPLRVVADSNLRMPSGARMLGLDGETLILTTGDETNTLGSTVEVVGIEPTTPTGGRADPASVLELLASRFAVNDLLLEAGPTLSGAFVQAGLVDQLIVFIGGKLLGSRGLPLLELPAIRAMSDRVELRIEKVEQIGNDCCVIASLNSLEG